MNPDVASALRIILIAAGTTLLVKPGLFDMPGLEQLAGGIITVASAVWSWWANRSKSKEAQIIAQKVADDPEVPGPAMPVDQAQTPNTAPPTLPPSAPM